MPDLKIAAVTGANRGIGLQACSDLAKNGFKVILTARNIEKGKKATDTLKNEGLDINFLQLDVRSAESISKFARSINDDFGKLDVLVNNAAIIGDSKDPGLSVEIDEVIDVIQTNVYGVLLLSQKIIPLMIKNNYGRIINFSSGMGQLSDMGSGYFAYRLSKTSINVISVVLANETKGHDIQINSVDPGWVKTDMGGSGANLSVEEGADTAVWLASRPEGSPTGKFFKNREVIDW